MANTPLTPQQKVVFNRLQTDLRYFCKTQLSVKLKKGGEGPFVFNKAQEYLHNRIEDQLARTGKVRIVILKGRQQGISTYTAARFYHKATRQRAKNVFILSHHAVTTEALFGIVDRFHTNCNPAVTPFCVINNNRKMKFSNHSQYTVGTAGSGAIGRGDTNQFFHWSEVAWCENIPDLITGISQTVADVPGTEKIYESTANGLGNFFHQLCMDAISGKGDVELVFIPWYWQDEYRAATKPDFELTEYEQQLKDVYKLDDEQIQWRRNKIQELKFKGDGERLFKQEYPCTIREAFIASGNSLIRPELIEAARKNKIKDTNAPYIVSIDPARDGDRTVIAYRQGRVFEKIEILQNMNEMMLAGKVANVIQKIKPDMVFIDITGSCGNGAVDRLNELGYRKSVTGVKFSNSPDDDRYTNKRAEMAGLLKEWFEEQGGCAIPDDDEVELELAMMPEFKVTSSGKLQLESKDKIVKDYGKSPDIFDAMMVSFAYPVRRHSSGDMMKRTKKWTTQSAMAANRGRYGLREVEDYRSDGPDYGTGFKRLGGDVVTKR